MHNYGRRDFDINKYFSNLSKPFGAKDNFGAKLKMKRFFYHLLFLSCQYDLHRMTINHAVVD